MGEEIRFEDIISEVVNKENNHDTILDDPDYPICREGYIKEIYTHLTPLFHLQKDSSGALIKGITGTGKTITLKYIIKELTTYCKKKGINFKPIFWQGCARSYTSSYALYKDILSYHGVECNNNFHFSNFIKFFKTGGGISLLILDELQELRPEVMNGVIRDLTRVNEMDDMQNTTLSGKSVFSYILASNFFDASRFTQNTKSSIGNAKIIIFEKYTKEQLLTILKEKTRMKQYTYKEDVAQEVVNHTHHTGDARVTLQRYGEIINLDNITPQAIKRYILEKEQIELRNQIQGLSNIVKITFKYCVYLSQETESFTSETIFQVNKIEANNKIQEQFSLSSISNAVSYLESIGLVTTGHRQTRGRSRNIFITPEQLEIYKKVVDG